MKDYDIFDGNAYNLLTALVRAERIVNRYAEKSVDRPVKMPHDQQYVCDLLTILKSGTRADFIRFLIREPSSVAQILGRMEKNGYIRKETLPGTRKLVFTLTDPELSDINKTDQICQDMFSGLSQSEQDDLKRLLDKLFTTAKDRLEAEHYSSPF
ncbi:MAG: MarR family transcriptional regulator [Dehalococcoides mccartyi]|uniref:MarR family transcriptional regulator n=1 Tax=Dehalococcoides mccartyi TaxID=61435 RepID=UPI000805CCD7|nr:MarR family transcriptional regulator [Dehalococcoides mccartyi]OBW62566.1 MAG: MarR family transcriptional regulator [Dehalococcoides mccartyi]